MAKSMARWIGLDVHARQTLATVFVPSTGEIEQRRIDGRPRAGGDWLRGGARALPGGGRAAPAGGGGGGGRPARGAGGARRRPDRADRGYADARRRPRRQPRARQR